jgi:hypothetical protein
LARPEGQTSNSLLDTLAEWNVYLAQYMRQFIGHQAPEKPFDVHLTRVAARQLSIASTMCFDEATAEVDL